MARQLCVALQQEAVPSRRVEAEQRQSQLFLGSIVVMVLLRLDTRPERVTPRPIRATDRYRSERAGTVGSKRRSDQIIQISSRSPDSDLDLLQSQSNLLHTPVYSCGAELNAEIWGSA